MTINLWTIDLKVDEETRGRLFGMLDASERERAARFMHPRDVARFVVAHGALRDILARATGLKPAAVRFHLGPQGKPALADGEAPPFNMAHRDDLAIVGIGSDGPLGVDVEALQPMSDAMSIARQHFAPPEVEALAALPPAMRQDAFYRLWTRKEALLKASGMGPSFPLDRYTVTHDDPARVLAVAEAPDEAASWQLRTLDLAPGHVAAVAWRGDPRPMVLRPWVLPLD